MSIRGRAHKFGAHIDTDQATAVKHLVRTHLGAPSEHHIENNHPEFVQRVQDS